MYSERSNKKIYILGASGHGKVVADIAYLCGYRDIIFVDPNPSVKAFGKYPVIKSEENLADGDVFAAIGDATIRKRLCEKFRLQLITLVHPNAVIARDATIGVGTVIMAGAVVNPGAYIGEGCIINTSASVDHDDQVGDYCHISVGAHLAGTVCVGDMTWIGAGAIASNNITICDNCVIGAGAVVVSDITKPGTYIGVPAKKMNIVEKDEKEMKVFKNRGGVVKTNSRLSTYFERMAS